MQNVCVNSGRSPEACMAGLAETLGFPGEVGPCQGRKPPLPATACGKYAIDADSREVILVGSGGYFRVSDEYGFSEELEERLDRLPESFRCSCLGSIPEESMPPAHRLASLVPGTPVVAPEGRPGISTLSGVLRPMTGILVPYEDIASCEVFEIAGKIAWNGIASF